MSLWEQRKQSVSWLADELEEEAKLLQEVLDLIGECIEVMMDAEMGEFSWVCGMTMLKGRNLGIGCLSLVLDGNGQISGAIARPLLEAIELLKYFRLDPERVSEAINDDLPSAGEIAQEIDGEFKFLRDYLNEHSSHFSYRHYSVQHLFNSDTSEIKTSIESVLQTSKDRLHQNLTSLFGLLIFLAIESASCVYAAGAPNREELADQVENLRERGTEVFGPGSMPGEA